MPDFLSSFLTASLFIPHGHCYLWKPGLVGLHIASDSLIALAYYSIPISLIYFVQNRKDLPFKNIFLLFGAFIISCGTTHIVDVWTLWHPIYWLSGFLKAFTAMISLCAATVTIPLIPKALALPSPAQLEAEISDRKQSEVALKKTKNDLENSYNLLRTIIENTPDAIFVKDIQGRHLTINYAGACVVGKSVAEIIDKDDTELFPPEVADQLMINDRTVIDKGETEIFEELIPTNNIVRTFLSTKSVYRDAEGKIVGVIGIARDITLAKKAEKSLKKSKERLEIRVQKRTEELRLANERLQQEIADRIEIEEALRNANQTLKTLIEASPLAIVTINAAGKITMWNPAAEKLFGWSESEVLDKNLPIIPPDAEAKFPTLFQTVLEGTRLSGMELSRQRKDASLIDVSLWTAPLYDNNGIIKGSMGLFVDISDRIGAEKALRENQQLLQAIIDNSPTIIYIKDTQGRYLLVNWKWSKLFGISSEETQGKTDWDIFSKEIAEAFWANDRQVIASGNPIEIEEIAPNEEGFHTYFSIKFPLKDAAGVTYAVCGISTDISDRKQIEAALKESEEQFRATFEQAAVGICHCGHDGKFLRINQRYCDIVGYTEAELGQLSFTDITHPEDLNADLAKFQALMTGEISTYSMEKRYIHRSGKIVWVHLTVSVVRSCTGEPKYEVAVIQDISDRKYAEAALQQSEQRYRSLVAATTQIVWLNNAQGQAVDMPEWGAYTGQSREEIAGFGWLNALHPDDRDRTAKVWAHSVATKSLYETEYRIRGKDGNYRYFSVRGVPVLAEDGSIREWVGVCWDIHDGKRAEAELRQSEARYRELATREALLNCIANQIRASLELDTILENAVQEIRELFQVERCLFIWYQLDMVPASWLVVQEAKNAELPSLMGEKVPGNAIAPLTTKAMQKQITCIEDTAKISDDLERQFFLSVGYKAVLLMPIHTQSGEIAVINCSNSSKTRFWTDADVELLQAVAAQIAIAIDQAALYKQTRITAEIAQTKAEQLAQALKELKETQAQLVQSEKMSSLGQLVAGVAHEINNPVNFIHGNLTHTDIYAQDLLKLVQLYQKHYPQPVPEIQSEIQQMDLDFLKEDLPKILSSMKSGTERIRNIVLSLRNFSHLNEAEMKHVDIHQGIDSTLSILQNRLEAKENRPAIRMIKEYGNLPLVECYAGQLNQVFLNILTNAIDAVNNHFTNLVNEAIGHSRTSAHERLSITKSQDPTIWIRTSVVDSNNVKISIADNGSGMTETVKNKLFDPFFTTKPVGSGTGLGMSICYRIIEKHGGQLTCDSTLGKGTNFGILIPISQLKNQRKR